MFEANPILTRTTDERHLGGRVTFNAIVNRTGILVLVAMATYALAWMGTGSTGVGGISAESFMPLAAGVSIGSLILGMYIIFARSCNPILISLYAAAQGFLLGTISRVADARYPGIAFETAASTFIIFLLVLGAYRLRILRATPLLMKIITVGMVGVIILYAWDMIGGWFGHPAEIVRGNSGGSIAVSVVIVLLASINFVLDFARAEAAVDEGASEEYSWQIAFGLLVGLVWLYVEILRLLSKTRSRR
jgi:uncharacterized YccA/Bax inhibitor family protein